MADERAERLAGGDAWRDFCERLKGIGERILEEDFPPAPEARAEGYRHLSRLTIYALQWFLEFQDTDFPAFHRYDDDIVKWGGPNADNHYLRAKVDPRGTYRVRLDTRGLRELILSTPEGDMQLEQYRVFEERNLSQLAIEPDGKLEVILSPEKHDGNWIPLHPEVDHVLIRLYVSDWERDAAPAAEIERIDRRDAAPGPLEPARVAHGLERAAEWVERSVVYWSRYLANRRAQGEVNKVSPPRSVPGGAADILYGGGWWELASDEALLVECEPPQARYWSIQLYSSPWFESLDIANRVCSLNGDQMQIDDDGKFRLVISARDPEIANWLDNEGRDSGLLSYRWVWSSTAPVPESRLVRIDDLRKHLPPATPRFDADARREQIARRRAALTHRFRR